MRNRDTLPPCIHPLQPKAGQNGTGLFCGTGTLAWTLWPQFWALWQGPGPQIWRCARLCGVHENGPGNVNLDKRLMRLLCCTNLLHLLSKRKFSDHPGAYQVPSQKARSNARSPPTWYPGFRAGSPDHLALFLIHMCAFMPKG